MTRSRAYYAAPFLFCILVHWVAIRTWFWGDDFAWLGLHLEIQHWGDWFDVLFGPRAQGTVRTLSERVYFLAFTGAFGLNAVPFRLWAFLTQFANLILLSLITQRLTGSRLAGFVAPLIWCVNAGLAVALAWSSAYNEVCCAFCILLSFYLLLRYIETGQRKYWIAQWAVFLLGFGTLELIVMYPAIAALYTMLWARRFFARTLWMFIPPALFTVWHFRLVPKSTDPQYAMHFGPEILTNLWHYWAFATGALRADVVDWRPLWLGLAMAVVALALVLALAWKNLRLALFGAAWFVMVLIPVLPLTQHFTEYYLTIPAIGLAILGAFGIARYRWIATPVVVLAAVLSVSDLRVTENFNFERARKMKRVVNGLVDQRALYAGKQVIVTGIDNDTFWSGFADDPFRLIGIPQIFLAPGTEKSIDPHPEWGGIGKFVTPLESALGAIAKHEAVVFSMAADGSMRDITRTYGTIAASAFLALHRNQVNVGDALYASRLGPGWYPIENGFRWMAKSASVQLAGAPTLAVSGYCPLPVVAKGSVELTVSADGRKLGSGTVKNADQPFSFAFAIPSELQSKYAITITVEVNRTIQTPSDPRPLGLIFGSFHTK
jgi:hypothetical protein